jgi:hypothetical protein
MPHDPDAPIQSIELWSASPSATQSSNNDSRNLPLKRFPTPLFCERGVLFGHWYQHPGGNGRRYFVYACPKDREFTVKRHGRIEPVRVTALFSARTGGRKPQMISCGSSLHCYGYRRSTIGPPLLSNFGSLIVSQFFVVSLCR